MVAYRTAKLEKFINGHYKLKRKKTVTNACQLVSNCVIDYSPELVTVLIFGGIHLIGGSSTLTGMLF